MFTAFVNVKSSAKEFFNWLAQISHLARHVQSSMRCSEPPLYVRYEYHECIHNFCRPTSVWLPSTVWPIQWIASLSVQRSLRLSVCLPVSFPVAVPVSRGCNVSEWTVTIDVGRINFTFNENVIELSSLYGLHAMTAIGKEKRGKREEGRAAGVSQVRRSCCTLPGQLAA